MPETHFTENRMQLKVLNIEITALITMTIPLRTLKKCRLVDSEGGRPPLCMQASGLNVRRPGRAYMHPELALFTLVQRIISILVVDFVYYVVT